jgi:hypothetical protein
MRFRGVFCNDLVKLFANQFATGLALEKQGSARAGSPDGEWIAYLGTERGKAHICKIRVSPGARPVVLAAASLTSTLAQTHWSKVFGIFKDYAQQGAVWRLMNPDGNRFATAIVRPRRASE